MLSDRRVIRFFGGLLIAALCIWYLANQVDGASLRAALASAEIPPIILAIFIILITGPAKTWRWQLLYDPSKTRPAFVPTYAALMVGQMVNIISPISRLGDLARIFHLHQSSGVNRGESLGTLVSEKSFDLLFTVLLVLGLLPLMTVPQFISNPISTLAIVAVCLLLALYLLAFRGEWVLAVFGRITRLFPFAIASRLDKLAASTLQGLSALRDTRRILLLLLANIIVTMLSVATPFIMFRAFGLSLGIAEAMLLNIAVVLGLSLPGAPGRVGLFEGVVYAMLAYFGVADESIQLGYAIIFHVVVLAPPLLIGTILAVTSGYNWRESFSFARSGTQEVPTL